MPGYSEEYLECLDSGAKRAIFSAPRLERLAHTASRAYLARLEALQRGSPRSQSVTDVVEVILLAETASIDLLYAREVGLGGHRDAHLDLDLAAASQTGCQAHSESHADRVDQQGEPHAAS